MNSGKTDNLAAECAILRKQLQAAKRREVSGGNPELMNVGSGLNAFEERDGMNVRDVFTSSQLPN